MTPLRHSRAGFTLLELVISIAIIGMLIGLLMPAVGFVRESARRADCLNRMRQSGLALHLHHDLHGRFPPRLPNGQPNDPHQLLQWQSLILPLIDQGPLWEKSVEACRVDPIPIHNPPHIAKGTVIVLYVCPNDSRLLVADFRAGEPESFSSYLGISGSAIGGTYFMVPGQILLQPAAGVLGQNPGTCLSDIRDGTSQTLMVGERPPPATLQAGQWYSLAAGSQSSSLIPGPNGYMTLPGSKMSPQDPCAPLSSGFGPGRIDNPCDRYHYWSLHPGGANFVMADASTRFFRYSEAELMAYLATRSGDEHVEIP